MRTTKHDEAKEVEHKEELLKHAKEELTESRLAEKREAVQREEKAVVEAKIATRPDTCGECGTPAILQQSEAAPWLHASASVGSHRVRINLCSDCLRDSQSGTVKAIREQLSLARQAETDAHAKRQAAADLKAAEAR